MLIFPTEIFSLSKKKEKKHLVPELAQLLALFPNDIWGMMVSVGNKALGPPGKTQSESSVQCATYSASPGLHDNIPGSWVLFALLLCSIAFLCVSGAQVWVSPGSVST